MTTIPVNPKIYHIVHIDRLPSIVADGCLWCDAEVVRRNPPGTTIGMSSIKRRRLHELTLTSHPSLRIGACVPFYFCPRSVMLYILHRSNDPELSYRGGQEPIVHLEAELHATVRWADVHQHRWTFALSNAGSRYFEDRCELAQLHEINWSAVTARDWRQCKEPKQAEFLLERAFPWQLVSRIGVCSRRVYDCVHATLQYANHKPKLEIKRDWYY